jgi:hypothetical protein
MSVAAKDAAAQYVFERSKLVTLARTNAAKDGADFPADRYRLDPTAYIQEYFGWSPWSGEVYGGATGQKEVIDHYVLCIQQQLERVGYNNGTLKKKDLIVWQPDEAIRNTISIDAGHTVGKTKLSAALLNHFFDCFRPSTIYSFAPTSAQIKDLLWKEIRSDREGTSLPGRILNLRLDAAPDHFAVGRATSNSSGTGSERVQGQHAKHIMFVVDEAEGVAEYVFEAIDSMKSGGEVAIVLVVRNPRTSSCTAHRLRDHKATMPFTISCLDHPNVREGRHIIPASVTREWVKEKIEDWCVPVDRHDIKKHTFEVDWLDGQIFEPVNTLFLWRVLGVVGEASATDALFQPHIYKAAVERSEPIGLHTDETTFAAIGVDVARYGDDFGSGWTYHKGVAARFAQWSKQDSNVYFRDVRDEINRLHDAGVTHLSIRVDGGGGYGSGLIDRLDVTEEIQEMFAQFEVHEISFNGRANDPTAYYDKITELYANAALHAESCVIRNPPLELKADLTERKYSWVLRNRRDVMMLEPKKRFKARKRRSPDDGDGFVLAVASDTLVSGYRESHLG